MTTGKTVPLTRWTLVSKVMSLLLNMPSWLVITFLPRSKRLLISWLQSPSAVILEPPKIKSATVSTVSPSISNEVMGPDAMIFVFWMLSFKPTYSLSSFTFSVGQIQLQWFIIKVEGKFSEKMWLWKKGTESYKPLLTFKMDKGSMNQGSQVASRSQKRQKN